MIAYFCSCRPLSTKTSSPAGAAAQHQSAVQCHVCPLYSVQAAVQSHSHSWCPAAGSRAQTHAPPGTGVTIPRQGFLYGHTLPCRDRSAAPFKCLDAQYRRELVRVYLTNVEGICRRFVEEKREQLLQLKKSMGAFQIFWDSQTSQQRAEHATMKGDEVHKAGRQAAWSMAQSLRLLAAQLLSAVGASAACTVGVRLVLAGITIGRLVAQVLCCRAGHEAILISSLLAVSMFALTSASFTFSAEFQVWWGWHACCPACCPLALINQPFQIHMWLCRAW